MMHLNEILHIQPRTCEAWGYKAKKNFDPACQISIHSYTRQIVLIIP